jgi:hypothetical protein
VDTVAWLTGPRALREAEVIGAIVIGVSALFVLLSFGASVYLCNFASYSCPAKTNFSNGCGNVPEHNCQASTTFAWYALAGGAPTLTITAWVLLSLQHRHRTPGRRDSA